ncbi:MAG: peptidoglycan DD-metalloendopeptidase family protein [Gammaproteobacteria bacterium]|nr:peptidoglycan DD-metalloendopeptidase family protein [Gammaproteobacteria bacterium]NNC98538.1 peptidoglycan DD-metalloendopeptidase family protein [Gammaproteobacteria bacterium]NNM13251.1 peptidoglycan DD-metalloendopeptidase family protein [Gammaproteobacteria bacterium]
MLTTNRNYRAFSKAGYFVRIFHHILGLLIIASLVIGWSTETHAASLQQQQSDLRKLQKRINNLQKQIRKDTRQRDASQAMMERIDQDIARTQKSIRFNQQGISESNHKIAALEEEQDAALGRMGEQQKQLAAMLKLTYQNQQTPAIKLILNEQDPGKLGRHLVYYKHIMQAQETRIDLMTEQVRTYVGLLDKAKLEKSNLQALQSKNRESLQELEKQRAQRQTLVAQLAANIKDQTREMQSLAAQEKALNQIVSELLKTLESFPDTRQQAFKNFRGKLVWPVQGRLHHSFGQPRIRGQKAKWQGVFVATQRNTEIRAVAYGRVVYADWLPGHGLITILDHGDKYLTLYANTEMLFKEVGTWVEAGEVIATVGDSGGMSKTGLYFEIRRGKSALNPQSWFKTRQP